MGGLTVATNADRTNNVGRSVVSGRCRFKVFQLGNDRPIPISSPDRKVITDA